MGNWLDSLQDIKLDELGNKKVPKRNHIVRVIKEIQGILFPNFYEFANYDENKISELLVDDLNEIIKLAFAYDNKEVDSFEYTNKILNQLPKIKEYLLTDITAIYNGDPAAKSKAEIVLCYPGFYAIMIYRIAHEFYDLKIPYIARIMTEYAHEKTGIDINPGATIGKYFCIDHGTGIVIGETAVIGENVKLYQGVTIGAKSFELDENGNPLKEGKRHPDIGNNVVIYANATILGGETKIGDNCVIGGNVWFIGEAKEGTTLYYNDKDIVKQKKL